VESPGRQPAAILTSCSWADFAQVQERISDVISSCGTANCVMPQDFFAHLLQALRGVTPCVGHGEKSPT